MCIYVKLDYS